MKILVIQLKLVNLVTIYTRLNTSFADTTIVLTCGLVKKASNYFKSTLVCSLFQNYASIIGITLLVNTN